MKNFKGLKSLFCLIFTFIFMFGNVLFVNAAVIEVEERAELETKCEYNGGVIYLNGTITYTCSDPYGDKKIIRVNDISLNRECYSWMYETVDFEQQSVDSINISEDGKRVTAYVCGKLNLRPCQEDEGEDVSYVTYVKIPVFYAMRS